MRAPRSFVVLGVVLGLASLTTSRSRAQAPTSIFHGIGDLTGPGGVGSAVRDATRVAGTIYAVGASTANATATGVPNLDTPALWTWAGSGSGTLEALPNSALFTSTQTSPISAYAVTADGAYLASQARPSDATGGTNWVRVTRSLLPDIAANLNLSNGPGTPAFAALAISDGGGVIYGLNQTFPGGVDTRVAVRYEPGLGFNFPDLTPAGKTWGFPIPRGTSEDGLVMVGAAANGQVAQVPIPPSGAPLATNAVAFRYVHTAGTLTGTTTLIPTLPGGSWNMPVALSATGDRTLVIGNSTSYPSGEVYLTDAAHTVTATLGSPNIGLMPRALGGMTAEGTVVAVTFATSLAGQNQINGLGIPINNKHAYIHNSYGWFHFASVLAAQGEDIEAMGWDPTNLAITGIRTVDGVDLVFGQGRRRTVGATSYVDGAVEGFVAELPEGVLAAFNPAPTTPADQSIVGAWALGVDPTNPTAVVTFLANGSFVFISSLGFERGLYTWAGNAAGGAFTLTTLYDTNGGFGLSSLYARPGLAIGVAGDNYTVSDSNCATCSFPAGARIMGGPGSIVGGWVVGNPAEPDNTFAIVLLDGSLGSKYFAAFDQPTGADDQVDLGTYTWDPVTKVLVATDATGSDSQTATLTRDELGLTIDEGSEVYTLTRVIAPGTVVPTFTGPSTVDGTTGLPFAFTIATTHTSTVSAIGLPPGLVIAPATAEITGAPTVAGSFAVLLTAQNSFGLSTNTTFTINVNAPAIVVVPEGENVTVEPDVPAGTPDVTMTFDNVGAGGTEVTVAVIDPETTPELAPEPPGNFEIVTTDGGVPLFYEITASAPLTGPVTLCFSYAGVDLGGETPRLFHYVNDAWVDITTSVDTGLQILCGETTSFSPFAIFKSAAPFVWGTGFYAPVSPLAGYLNTVKGGATVPLKFDVYVNGVERTTTEGLAFTVLPIACDSGAPEDAVDFVTTESTHLRYDASGRQFVQTWKAPKTPGACYTTRITTADGLALTARFKVK